MINTELYPNNKTFWRYNLICWGVLVGFDILLKSIFLQSLPHIIVELVGLLIFVVSSLHSCLIFRLVFRRRRFATKSIVKLILLGFAFACLAGIGVGILVGIYGYASYTIFLPEKILEVVKESGHLRFFLLACLQNALLSFLYVAIWIFIYIAVSSYRKSIDAEIEALRLQNSLKESQINTLAGQLNPHFLFNALNNIRFMIGKDGDSAENMLTHLSEILRYSLESSKRDKLPLRQELAIVDQYLALATVQLNDRLRYVKDVQTEAEECLVPPMVIQMLVENAIKHGLDQIYEGGELSIHVVLTGERLSIVLSNDMPLSSVSSTLTKPAGTRLGLRNISKRLELLYGDDASIETHVGQGRYSVTVCLPKEASQ